MSQTQAGQLEPRQQRFVDEYLVDLNATQAAIRAGYSKKTAQPASSRLLSHVIIADAIAAKRAKLAEKFEVTRDQVLREYAKIGFSDIRRAITWGNTVRTIQDGVETTSHGVSLLASEDIDQDTAAAIAEISETKDGLKLKFHDKRAALDSLSKILGFNAPTEISGPNGGPIEVSDVNQQDAVRLIAFAFAKALAVKEPTE